MYVVFFNTSDFPDLYVVRECTLGKDATVSWSALARSADTLEEVRRYIPHGLTRLDRHPNDDPVIVETWL